MLDPAAAAALFAIVVGSTQGHEMVARQTPLHVEDHGDAFLVFGSPSTEGRLLRFVKCHVFFAKRDAEVLGFGCDGRQILSRREEDDWRGTLTPDQFDAVFGEPFHWKPDGISDLVKALYGGVVNTPDDAVAYAKILLQTSPRGTVLARGLLTAVERDGIWHIARVPETADVMTLSRTTGQLLSPLP